MNKKLFLMLIGLLVMALMIGACGPKEAPTEPAQQEAPTEAPAEQEVEEPAEEAAEETVEEVVEEPAAAEPVTIKFWHVWGGARLEMIDAMIADFNVEYPNITVEHTLLDQADMVQKYLTAIASGDPPDVIMVHGANFFQAFADQGALMPLDDYVAADGMNLYDIFYQADMDTYIYDGIVYGLPLATGAGMYVFHIDVDAFEAAGLEPVIPKTWEEVKSLAEKLTIKDGDTFTQIGFAPYGFTNFPFKEWLFLNNGTLLSDDGKTILFNSPEGLEALTWMVDFYNDLYGGFDKIVDLAGDATATGYNDRDNWYNGAVAMHVDGIWHNAQLVASAPEKNVMSGLMPYNGANPDATNRNIVEGGWAYCIPNGAANPEAGWTFLKYATAGEGNHSFFMAQGRPTPVKAYNEDPAMAEGNVHWAAYIANIEVSEKSPVTPVSAEINEVITLMTEEALFGVKTPEQALADGAESAQAILDEFWGN
ncbi:MAG: ABC transporter substrate-binding protein [Anaerolineales bacterium]|nr:ABC transporter substrate-binding protein [Anaerolineales bacterium]